MRAVPDFADCFLVDVAKLKVPDIILATEEYGAITGNDESSKVMSAGGVDYMLYPFFEIGMRRVV